MTNWQSGLCSCFDDWGICCYGCWCPACLYGENAVQIDGSDYDDACCAYCLSGQIPSSWTPIVDNRTALRNKYGLVEEPCDDCLVVVCCGPCAVCQAARELNSRKNMPGVIQNPIIMAQPTNIIGYQQQVQTTEPISFIAPQQP